MNQINMSEEEIQCVIKSLQFITIYTFNCYNEQQQFDFQSIKHHVISIFDKTSKELTEYYFAYMSFLPLVYNKFVNIMDEYKKIYNATILGDEINDLFQKSSLQYISRFQDRKTLLR